MSDFDSDLLRHRKVEGRFKNKTLDSLDRAVLSDSFAELSLATADYNEFKYSRFDMQRIISNAFSAGMLITSELNLKIDIEN